MVPKACAKKRGERLRLIPARKEDELIGIGLADTAQPIGRNRQSLVPADLGKLARATRPDSLQWRTKPSRRQDVHDPGRSLGAQHPAIDRVISVALDVAKCAVPQMDLNAAATGAHVARGIRNLITNWLRIFYVISWHWSLTVNSTAINTSLAERLQLDLLLVRCSIISPA